MNGIFTYIWLHFMVFMSVDYAVHSSDSDPSTRSAKDDDPTFRVAGWGRMDIPIDGFAWDAWDWYIYRSMNGWCLYGKLVGKYTAPYMDPMGRCFAKESVVLAGEKLTKKQYSGLNDCSLVFVFKCFVQWHVSSLDDMTSTCRKSLWLYRCVTSSFSFIVLRETEIPIWHVDSQHGKTGKYRKTGSSGGKLDQLDWVLASSLKQVW